MREPLRGVRVLDLSWIIAGPLASRLLADFGADVIKIESRRRPDVGRGNRTPLFGVLPGDANSNSDVGGYFQDVNAGKRSCTLDLQTDGGRELLGRLIAVSDAVVCNLSGDQLDRWGYPYERLRELNPGIVVINMPAMEASGDRAHWRAFGDHFANASGIKALSGAPGEDPVSFGHQYPDFGPNPFHAAVALVSALHRRKRTGAGAYIELSQYESTIAVTGTALLEHAVTGAAPGPQGNVDADAVPHNIYRCAGDDSWCAIAIYDDDQWRALASTPGLEPLRDAAFAQAEGRRRHESEIDEVLEAWSSSWDRQDLAAFLQARGVPAGPMQRIHEMVELDPTLSAEHFARVPHPVGRDFLVHRNPLRMRRRPPTTALGPLLGRDTYEVPREVLDLSSDEIAEYAAAGALD